MSLTAEQIATKYAGKVVKCVLTKSKPVSTGKTFEGKVVGWRKGDATDPTDFVVVEVLPPAQTHFQIGDFKKCTWTYDKRNKGAYGKRVYPEEIETPTNAITHSASVKPKEIPAWPHKCKDCGSPAFIGSLRIDCSNDKCIHKFKTRDAKDLFLPINMRNPGWDKDFSKNLNTDENGFLICLTCRAKGFSAGPVNNKGEVRLSCDNKHSWTIKPQAGEKIVGAKNRNNIYAFNGRTFTTFKG